MIKLSFLLLLGILHWSIYRQWRRTITFLCTAIVRTLLYCGAAVFAEIFSFGAILYCQSMFGRLLQLILPLVPTLWYLFYGTQMVIPPLCIYFSWTESCIDLEYLRRLYLSLRYGSYDTRDMTSSTPLPPNIDVVTSFTEHQELHSSQQQPEVQLLSQAEPEMPPGMPPQGKTTPTPLVEPQPTSQTARVSGNALIPLPPRTPPAPARDRIVYWRHHNEVITIARWNKWVCYPNHRDGDVLPNGDSEAYNSAPDLMVVPGEEKLVRLSGFHQNEPNQQCRFDGIDNKHTASGDNRHLFEVIKPVVSGFLDGFRVMISTHAFTGSECYSALFGGAIYEEPRGLISLSIVHLLEGIGRRYPGVKPWVTVKVGLVYKNELLDLGQFVKSNPREWVSPGTPAHLDDDLFEVFPKQSTFDDLYTTRWHLEEVDAMLKWCNKLSWRSRPHRIAGRYGSMEANMVMLIEASEPASGSLVLTDGCGVANTWIIRHTPEEASHVSADRAAYISLMSTLSKRSRSQLMEINKRLFTNILRSMLSVERVKLIYVCFLSGRNYYDQDKTMLQTQAAVYGSVLKC